MITQVQDRKASSGFQSHTVLMKTGRCLEADLDGEIVLMDLHDGAFFSLTDTARECWKLISEGATYCTIIARLTLKHNVEREVCEAEVSRFIEDLIESKLVRAHRLSRT